MFDRLRGYPLTRAERRETILTALDRGPYWQSEWDLEDAVAAQVIDKPPSVQAIARDLRALTRTGLVEVMGVNAEHGGDFNYYGITAQGRAIIA